MQTDFCPNCFAAASDETCPQCGYHAVAQAGNHMILPPGTVLNNRYLVGRVLGAGGFGITYLARDRQNGMLCAIKEYLPAVLAVRESGTLHVVPSSSSNRGTYDHGLSIFSKEAQTLGRFKGENAVVQIWDFFSQNGTAYFVMEYLDGVNLKALAKSMGGRVPAGLGTEILERIAITLKSVHAKGLLHRDVSPENIFITKAGEVKLIDFGATRFFVGEKSRSLSVILKPGFAPPEQYSSKGNQGPWTDIYALCATFYAVVTGAGLPDAPDRLAGKAYPPLNTAAQGISPQVAQAVEQGLALDWRQRHQSMENFLRAYRGEKSGMPMAPPPRVAPSAPSRAMHTAAVQARGNPYVQLYSGTAPGDKWVIPKNMAMVIGRSSERCNIVLDHPNVSRIHCQVQYNEKAGQFILTDLSTNGTFFESGRLTKNQPYAVKPGEMFFIMTRDCSVKVGLE